MYLKSSILIWNRNLFSNILSFPNFFQFKLIKVVSVAAYSLVKSVAFPDFLSRKTARHTWALSSCKLRMKLLNRVASVVGFIYILERAWCLKFATGLNVKKHYTNEEFFLQNWKKWETEILMFCVITFGSFKHVQHLKMTVWTSVLWLIFI